MAASKVFTSWLQFVSSSSKADVFCLLCLLLATSVPETSCKPTAGVQLLTPKSKDPTIADRNDVTDDASGPFDCSEPKPSELKKQWTAHHGGQGLHPSYYVLPGFRHFIEPELAKTGSPKEFMLSGNQECPESLYEMSKQKEVQERSLCPWYNVINEDVTRYPVDLVEARCSCTSCVGVSSDTGAGCEPVYYNLPVLRRTNTCDEKGVYKYEKSWQRLAVGCTCAMAQES